MKTLTLKIDEDTVDELDDEVDERGYSSRSEYLREIIDTRHEADELRDELDRAEARADDLRRQLQERGGVEEKVETLVERTEGHGDALREAVESSRDAREWSRAGLVTRTKWRLFGRPSTNGDGHEEVENGDG